MFNLLNRLKFQWLFYIFLFLSLSNSHGKKTDEKVWKIVYKKDLPQGVICTINSDGTGKKRLTPKDKWSETPIPTPDGQHIEYVSEDPDSQVLVHYLMDIDGKNRRLLTDTITFQEILYKTSLQKVMWHFLQMGSCSPMSLIFITCTRECLLHRLQVQVRQLK